MIDEATQIPLSWLIGLAGIFIGLFFWWLKTEFRKNDEQHKESARGMRRIHSRIDHLIMHLLPGKPYKDQEPLEESCD